MLIEAIDQAERAVEAMLSVDNRGAAAASDFRRGLRRFEVVASKLGALRTAAASCVAAFERYGIGGVQVFAGTAGLTRSDARGVSSLCTGWGGQHQALSMKFQQLSERLG